MKKLIMPVILAVCLAGALSPVTVCAQDTGTLSLLPAISVFGFQTPSYHPSDPVVATGIPLLVKMEYGKIEGESNLDTIEEFYTAYYFSPLKIDSVEAVLPKDGKRFPLVLYTMWKMKAAGVMFSTMDPELKKKTLANYDQIEKTILTKGGVSVAEAEAYYKTAVAAEVDRVVAEQFSRVHFRTTDKKYDVTLQKTGEGYVVNFDDALGHVNTYSVKSLSELSKYGFTAKQIEDCRINSGNIPVVVYSTPAYPQDERNPMKVVARLIKDFLIAPDETRFNTLASLSLIYARYSKDHPVYATTRSSFGNSLVSLSSMLGSSYQDRVNQMAMGQIPVAFLPPTSPKDLAWFMFPIASGNGGILFRVPTADGWLR
jgi:hypothetical protein